MAVCMPPEPDGGRAIAARFLRGLIAQGLAPGIPPGSLGSDLHLAAPYRLYALSRADVAGGGIDRARPVGWRYLVLLDDEAVAEIDLCSRGDCADLEFAGLGDRDQARAMVATHAAADAFAEGLGHDVEARFLTAPELGLSGIWLHSDERDWVVPRTAFDDATPARAIPADDLVARARDRAGKHLPFFRLRYARPANEVDPPR